VKRFICMALLAVAVACGSSDTEPTPRPAGQRGRILNPIDKTRDTADRQDDKTSEVQRYGGEYEQSEYPAP
jgi:hypothetical protein